MSELGQAIVLYRTLAKMPRKQLAIEAGISYPYLSEIENGLKLPTLDVLAKIATALGRKPSQIMVMAERLDDGEQVLG